jgi:hypothetical protein
MAERQPCRLPISESRRKAPRREEPVSNDRSYRIKSETLEADRAALAGLQGLSAYAPTKQAYSVKALVALNQALDQARQHEIQVQNALAAARDAARVAEWSLHDAMLGAKAEVIVQFGADSDAIQALGLKKKSKRRRATPRSSSEA